MFTFAPPGFPTVNQSGHIPSRVNQFRGASYGQERKLEFRIPRDRYGHFHPQILAILRNQEEECDRLAGILYTKELRQERVSDVFDQIYGQRYSKSSISCMVECMSTNPGDDGALTLRGLKYWSLGRRADAINDYLAALEINPESKAKQAMQATYDILDYYNKDLYNP